MDKRKSFLFSLAAAAGLAALSVVAVLILRHEPAFYRAHVVAPGAERRELSTKFLSDFAQLCITLQGGGPDDWHFRFSEDEINSFFQEDFMSKGDVENLRKLGISEPRVAFDDDGVRFAFRYGSGWWSTVLSYDLRIWAVPKEANVLAVEIRGRRVGGLPMSSQGLLSELVELAAKHNIELTAYRLEGNPVAVIHFQADQPNPASMLKCLKVAPGTLLIGGSCNANGPAAVPTN